MGKRASMKKVLFWIITVFLALMIAGYLVVLFVFAGHATALKIVLSVISCLISVALFVGLLLSLKVERFADLIWGFELEVISTALITGLFAFMVITS